LDSGIQSAVKKEYIPYGHVAAVTKVLKEGTISSGDVIDNVLNVAGDGFSGYAAGAGGGVRRVGGGSRTKALNSIQLIRCRRTLGANCVQPARYRSTGAGPISGYLDKLKYSPIPGSNLPHLPPGSIPVAPDVAPAVAPDVAPDIAPEEAPDMAPGLAPELAPEVVPELAPEVVPELAPEVVPELAPEVVPELAPEVVPESAPAVAPNALWSSTINRFRILRTAYIPRDRSSGSNINQELPQDKPGDEQPEEKPENEQSEGNLEDVQKKEEPEDEQKKTNRVCNSQPQIPNRNQQTMRDCVGKEVGQTCSVWCDANYSPNKREVKCVDGTGRKGEGKWNIDGALCIHQEPVECRDEDNKSVDWFIMYKLPNAAIQNGLIPKNGQTFLFMSERADDNIGGGNDADDPPSNWKHMDWKPLVNTLAPIRQEQSEGERPQNRNTNGNLVYAIYSDQPPGKKPPDGFAHAKGNGSL
jgi:hypothetical protein